MTHSSAELSYESHYQLTVLRNLRVEGAVFPKRIGCMEGKQDYRELYRLQDFLPYVQITLRRTA